MTKRNMHRGLVGLVAASVLAITNPSLAGSLTAKVGTIAVHANGFATVFMAGSITAPDACSTTGSGMTFDARTNEGKALLSTLNAAFLANRTVTVLGTSGNNCASTGVGTFVAELLSYVIVQST